MNRKTYLTIMQSLTGKLAGIALLLLALSPIAFAQANKPTLKVVDHIWGFDGRIQPGQFNPLSILVDNQTSEPIEATASLQRVQGMLNRSGGQYVKDVYISATARQWIQFYPYISSSYQVDWELTFNDGDKLLNQKIDEFTQPRPAYKLDTDKEAQPPQIVILDRAEVVTARPTSVKHLPENIFPPYATATIGLHTVFLDHVPDWEVPRQQAFLSWLKQGGRLHVLKDQRNEFPQFGGELTELNQPLNQFSVNNGTVVRHQIQREEVTDDLVRRVGKSAVTLDKLNETEQLQKVKNQGLKQFIETEPSAIDDSMFRQMRVLTFPDHNWFLIFVLALCYIGLLFPGCYQLSRKKQFHFLSTYGAIVGLSVVFSFLFLIIGRRGYGESTNIQTLAIARAEDATNWNVFQWNTFFVTSGGNYSAGANDQQSVYSTANTLDRQDVIITAGNNGRIEMKVPPFSSQTFVSRRRLASRDWKLKIRTHSSDASGLVSLSIQTGDDFPALDGNKYLALSGKRIYTLKYDSATKRLELFGSKKTLNEFCQRDFNAMYGNPWISKRNGPEDIRSEKQRFLDDSLPTLVARSLLDDLILRPFEFRLAPDRIRLFVYTDIPKEFQIAVSADVQASGRILFTKDLQLQDQTTATR